MRIVTSQEMRLIDEKAIHDFGIPSIVLMENAGARSAELIADRYEELGYESEILVFAGKGKNGGDALVVARHLISMGKKIRLFLLHDADSYMEVARCNLDILLKEKVRPVFMENISPLEEFLSSGPGPYLAVDGLLGIGFKGPLAGLYADVVDCINNGVDYCVSLDVPTGVDGTTGAVVGQCVHSDLTLAFGFAKLGHYIAPGALHRGELQVIDISLPPKFRKEGSVFAIYEETVAPLLQRRDRYGHKNSFGHCLLIGGSQGQLGAISMASRAALRMGTGLVSAATWPECWETLMGKIADEIMTMAIETEAKKLQAQRQRFQEEYSSVVLGPGLDTGERAERLLQEMVLYYHGPLVIDADGINLLADVRLRDLLLRRTGPTVLTPHIGEMARMMGAEKDDVLQDPMGFVRRAVEATNAIVLLKGATTFIGVGENQIYLNDYPNDGMATAGSGDVLAGMIGGLLGQGMKAEEAVSLAVFLHSLSGDFAAHKLGHRAMSASDIINNIGESFLHLRRYKGEALETINS